ncbi:unnamed protein product [Amoebophrya sp. A25]|nr:unnamed protein product [Amoebophrya sp. A25]|eukprot:GSA25T00014412001.1
MSSIFLYNCHSHLLVIQGKRNRTLGHRHSLDFIGLCCKPLLCGCRQEQGQASEVSRECDCNEPKRPRVKRDAAGTTTTNDNSLTFWVKNSRVTVGVTLAVAQGIFLFFFPDELQTLTRIKPAVVVKKMPEQAARKSKVVPRRGSRCTGFRTLQALEDGLFATYTTQKKREMNRERTVGSRQGPRQMFSYRPPTTKQCSIVPRSNCPSALKDGRFSFFRDLRPPFTVTGLAVLDDQSGEFQRLQEESPELRKVPLAELNEVYKIEWEAYLGYDIERNFTDIEDRRIYGCAVVKVPLGYKGGPLLVFSWGTPSCFDKKLEFLFKPESKKFFGPTKGKMPPDQASLNRSQRLGGSSPTSRFSSDAASTAASWNVSANDSFDASTTAGSAHWPTVPFGRRTPFVRTGATTAASDPGTTRASPASSPQEQYYGNLGGGLSLKGSPVESQGGGLSMRSSPLDSSNMSWSPRTRAHSAEGNPSSFARKQKLNRTGVNLVTGWKKLDENSRGISFTGSLSVTNRVLSDNLFASTGHELGFFQHTRVFDVKTNSWKPARKSQKCRYRDPDFRSNCMHASKIMSSDRKPFLSVLL